jgi:hypothetical protein
MNFSNETIERVVSLLQDIGATDKLEFKAELSQMPEASEVIWCSLDTFDLDTDRLELLIRGVCHMEAGGGRPTRDFEERNKFRLGFGSTTVIPRLLNRLNRLDRDRADNLTDWLFSNRLNTYSPFGYQIPLGVNSREEYAEYEDQRALHRGKMLAIDKEAHRVAVARKLENARLHAERSATNRTK